MTLRQKQSLFVRLVGRLIAFTYSHPGWELTFGDGHVSCGHGHMKGSLHFQRLAQDFNLFVDGKWMRTGCPEWDALGAFWTSLDSLARWGGHFRSLDYNHFSVAHEGKA